MFMRIELEIIQKIEMYLMGTLSPNDKADFESQLNRDPELQKNVDLQRSITEGIQRMALKTSAQNAYAGYKLQAFLTKLILIAVLVAAATFATIAVLNSDSEEAVAPVEYDEKAFTFPENDSLSADANQYLEQEFFTIKTSLDTIIETKDGIVIYIPADAFNTSEAEVELLVQGAVTTEDILKAGLSTITADGQELETGGMFYIDAYVNGQRVDLKKELTVDVPTNEEKAGMQLYDGEKNQNGEVVWSNPKKIESFLTPVEITSLDFYPPCYEEELNTMGYSEKPFMDSLYYSFACEDAAFINNTDPIVEGSDSVSGSNFQLTPIEAGIPESVDQVIEWNVAQSQVSDNMFLITITAHQREGWNIQSQKSIDGGILEPTRFSFSSPDLFKKIGTTQESEPEARIVEGIPQRGFYRQYVTFKQKIQAEKGTRINITVDYMVSSNVVFPPSRKFFSVDLGMNGPACSGINPASVKTIWNADFNNTNLATKEFEQRMPWIHQSCNNAVLELYINNLDKPLSTVDSMAFKYLSGEVLEQFKAFALSGDGRVEVDNVASKKLAAHYEEKHKAHALALAQTQQQFWNDQANLDTKNVQAQQHSNIRSEVNQNEIFNKEYKKNLCKVYDELDNGKDCNAPIPAGTFTVQVNNLGWKNIDRLVFEATAARTITTFSDNGKTAVLTYNSWSATITDHQKYDRINVYNIPVEFNSYIKLPGTNGKYEYKLNADLDYKTIILAWTAEGIYFYGDLTNPGDHTISLNKVTDEEWRNNIRNSLSSLSNMNAELDYIDYSQKDQKRINSNKERQKLREKIEPVVFPCGGQTATIISAH
jgi:hypothetical protein